jgi:nucleotide-binding universal stress UspA family protein
MSAGAPVLVGYDGSDGARRAIREAAELFRGRKAIVTTAWEPALAYGGGAMPGGMDLQPAPLDVGAAQEISRELEAHARRTAEEGAELARSAGLEVEPLCIAKELDVAEALVEVARERGAAAIVVGSRGLTGLRARLEGSTSSGVLKHANCPVVVVHDD